MREILFFFDIVCPFAYTASTLLTELSIKLNARFIWKPVLLGGLYKATDAPQGAKGSAMDPLSNSKRMYSGLDLLRTLSRYKVAYKDGVGPTQRTLTPMRLLTAAPDQNTLIPLAHRLFRMYWFEGRDMTQLSNLQEAVEDVQWPVDAENTIELEEVKQQLKRSTEQAAEMGVFGVPTFQFEDSLFFGVDSIYRLAHKLSATYVKPLRVYNHPMASRKVKLAFYYDYSSPWSFLAFSRLEEVLRNVAPVQVEVEFIPVLVGGIFRILNAPMVPLTTMPRVKAEYYSNDLNENIKMLKLPFVYSSHFPLRSVLALRADIASGHHPLLMQKLFSAAWQGDKNIAQDDVISDLIREAGLDSKSLLLSAQSDAVKAQLRANTERAVANGAFGVPTFQVDGGNIVWGQDRLNVVEDLICGWPDVNTIGAQGVKSKL